MPVRMSRRSFIAPPVGLCGGGCALPLAGQAIGAVGDVKRGGIFYPDKEARHYEKLPDKRIECTLCPNRCKVGDRERGACGVRINREGRYYTLVWGNSCVGSDGGNPDPIEKKPLFHFLPTTRSYSIATAGCNVACKFCQNWDISQVWAEQTFNHDLPPKAVVANAKRHRCRSIAYTYSEPVIFYEYMYDTAVAGRAAGIKSVMISNGYIEKEPMVELCKVLDGVKIDLKAFTEEFYEKLVGGKLRPVLDTLVTLREQEMWFEIVYLVIPTHNDDPDDIKRMSKWIMKELGPHVPLHFTVFHPTYRLKNLPRTPVSTVTRCRKIAMDEGLKYAYVGNVAAWPEGDPGESTYCHKCGKKLIHRVGFLVRSNRLRDGKCPYCGTKIPGVWE